jgi:hypothetical protein
LSRQRAETPEKCCLDQVCNLRCTSPPSRTARDGGGGDDDNETTYCYIGYESKTLPVNNFEQLAVSIF